MDESTSIGDLAAIVTVAGLAVYVVGLVGVAVTLRFAFNTGFSTAWYAVSLLPRTVVVGQGLKLWLLWPTLINVVPILHAFNWFGLNRNEAAAHPTSLSVSVAIVLQLVFSLTFLVSSVIFVIYRHQSALRQSSRPSRRQSSLLAFVMSTLAPVILVGMLGIALDLLGLNLVVEAAGNAQYRSPLNEYMLSLVSITPEYVPLAGVVFVLVGSFLITFLWAAGLDPPLIRVTVIWRLEAANVEGVQSPLEGFLVSHNNGFWHLFDNTNELLSIPDEQVLAVRTTRRRPLIQD